MDIYLVTECGGQKYTHYASTDLKVAQAAGRELHRNCISPISDDHGWRKLTANTWELRQRGNLSRIEIRRMTDIATTVGV